jgi:hypothetical protein
LCPLCCNCCCCCHCHWQVQLVLFEHLGATRAIFELYARRPRQPAHGGPSSATPPAIAAMAPLPPLLAQRASSGLLPLPQRAVSALPPLRPLMAKPPTTVADPPRPKRKGTTYVECAPPPPLPPPGAGSRAEGEPVLELSGWLMLWKDAGLLGPAPTQLSDLELQQVLVASQQSLVVGTNLGLADSSLNYTDYVEALLRVAWRLQEKNLAVAWRLHETAIEMRLATALREGLKGLARGWLQVPTHPLSHTVAPGEYDSLAFLVQVGLL